MIMSGDSAGMKNILVAVIKITLLILFIVGIPVYMYFFQYEFITGFRSLDDVIVFLEHYGVASIFVYIGLQVMQVVISVIPAQFFNLASGYVFSFWFGYLFSIIGIALGTTATFYLARILGKDAVYLLFGERKIAKFINNLNSKRALIVIFIIYLIPGLPKDLMGYAVGLSKTKFLPFLALSLIGRTPAMMMTIMVGSMLNKENYTGVFILSAIVIIVCIVAFMYRKRIIARLDKEFKRF